MNDSHDQKRDGYDVCRLRIEFDGEEIPWMYPLALNGRVIQGVYVDNERYERVMECEMERSFIEPRRLDFMQEYLCSECGEYSYMQIACDGDGINYCSICGARAVNRV